MKRTPEEVKDEVEALKAMKPNVRHYGLGSDNWEAIEAQITVLERRLGEDQIYDRFPGEDEEDGDQYVLDSALDARHWLDGQKGATTPHEDWQNLVEK